MRDWRKLVGRELAALALESREREDVIEELAAHLEDMYENLCARGLAEDDAARCCVDEVNNWRELRRNILIARKKENVMPDRVKQLWLPCLLTFGLFLGFNALAPLLIFGHAHQIVTHNGMPRMLPAATRLIPWLLSWPLVGAIGAFFSRRAGGTLRAMLSSAIFPVVPFLVFFAVGFPLALDIRDPFARGYMLSSFLGGLAVFVLLPAALLLGGGLSLQLFLPRRQSNPGALAQ
ncbi:MAG: permease prefix domain 1-containing protein [Candidatus Acidiferrales bacterium]